MDEKLMLMGWGKTDRTENRKNGTYIRGVRGREYFHEGGGELHAQHGSHVCETAGMKWGSVDV